MPHVSLLSVFPFLYSFPYCLGIVYQPYFSCINSIFSWVQITGSFFHWMNSELMLFISKMKTFNRNRLINLEKELTVTWGDCCGRDRLGIWDDMYKLLHLKQKTNKDLLIAQGTLFSILKWPKCEKNLKKHRYVYMYKWITLLYTWK